MPYIDEYNREAALLCPKGPGELNYKITRAIADYLLDEGLTYGTLNTVIGVLECAKLELYRRIASPYEDKKMVKNGDLVEYKELQLKAITS